MLLKIYIEKYIYFYSYTYRKVNSLENIGDSLAFDFTIRKIIIIILITRFKIFIHRLCY